MKKTWTRLITVLLLLTLTAAVLCGCGSKTGITISAEGGISLPVTGVSMSRPVTNAAVQNNRLVLTVEGEGTGSVKAIAGGSEVIFTVTVKDGKANVTCSSQISFDWKQD